MITAPLVYVTTDASGATSTTVDMGLASNDFIPENPNFGSCVSSLPRPDCGSSAQGGYHQLLTFGVLMLGMAFIGWRVFRSVRRAEKRMPDVPTSR